MKIYLISGKARNGKDTIGNYIVDYYLKNNKKIIKTAYGKYIKMYTQELTSWDGKEETKDLYRDFFQSIGTQLIRQKMHKEDFFVRRMVEDIEVYQNFVDAVVISDVRFPIEINYLKEKFANIYSIRVIRPNFASELNEKQLKHETEISLTDEDNYDYRLINTTLDKLKSDVEALLEGIEKNEKIN